MTRIGFIEPIDPKRLDRSARLYPSGSKTDQRSPAQRDRDRVLYASSFRRLGGITQVVMAVDEGHVFHNRLTHSVKVAQIGRRLAEKILFETDRRPSLVAEIERGGGLDPDVVEAVGLAHDLGHPPFGHIGEQELDDLTRQLDPDGFEGNAQSFRILTRLAQSGGRTYPGLNLTRATLAAVQKYPWRRPVSVAADRPGPPKFGAYADDVPNLQFAFERASLSLRKRERTLEAQIMDWADDITYAVHDVEDFFRAHWTPLDRLHRGILEDASKAKAWLLSDEVRQLFAGAQKAWYKRDGPVPSDDELLRAAKLSLIEFPFEVPYTGSSADRQNLRAWSSILIGRYVEYTTFGKQGLIRPRFLRCEIALLKQITKQYVIDNPLLSTHQYGQRRVLRRLYRTYLGALRKNKIDVFPYRFRAEAAIPTTERERARFVCDVLTGMSELAVLHADGRLSGMALGPLEDPAVG